MKKYFASICMAIVAMLTFTACCVAACNADSITAKLDKEVMDMEEIINQKEAELDSLDNIMPLSDTVGETDTYCDMLEARDAFNYSRSIQKKREHYRDYLWLQSLVVETAKDWMKENGTEDRRLLQNKTQDK
jgi:hypothetical protein